MPATTFLTRKFASCSASLPKACSTISSARLRTNPPSARWDSFTGSSPTARICNISAAKRFAISAICLSRVCAAPNPNLSPRRRMNVRVWREHAAKFSEEDLTRFFNILLETDDDLRRKPDPRLHLELGLLRLVNAQRLAPLEEILGELRGDRIPARSAQGQASPSTPPRTNAPTQAVSVSSSGAAAVRMAPVTGNETFRRALLLCPSVRRQIFRCPRLRLASWRAPRKMAQAVWLRRNWMRSKRCCRVPDCFRLFSNIPLAAK